MEKKILFINCEYAGISGDMMLSSLAQLIGQSQMTRFLEKIIEILPQSKNCAVNFEPKLSNGISGLHLNFNYNHDNNKHQHEFPHIEPVRHIAIKKEIKSNHHHYSVSQMKNDLSSIFEKTDVSVAGKELGLGILANIIKAESIVHQKKIQEIHLHEIGSIDTIIDIAGTVFGLEQLGLFAPHSPLNIYATSIALGYGTVFTAHGKMPVPAPATTQIIQNQNLSIIHGPHKKELATPTGVSIIATLKEKGYLIQEIPKIPYSVIKIGIGVGNLKFEKQANILQLFYGIQVN